MLGINIQAAHRLIHSYNPRTHIFDIFDSKAAYATMVGIHDRAIGYGTCNVGGILCEIESLEQLAVRVNKLFNCVTQSKQTTHRGGFLLDSSVLDLQLKLH